MCLQDTLLQHGIQSQHPGKSSALVSKRKTSFRRIWVFWVLLNLPWLTLWGWIFGSRLQNTGKQEEGEVEWRVTVLSQHPTPRLAHTCTRGRCRSAVLLPRETWEGGRARQRQQAHLSSGLDRSRFEILLTLHFQI